MNKDKNANTPIGHVIESDEVYIGGKRKESKGGRGKKVAIVEIKAGK